MTDDPAASKATYACPTCGLEYSRMEYLRRHQRKHTEDRPFKCEDCPKDFARSDVLLRHRRRCHPEEQAALELSPTTTTTPPSRAKEPVVKPKPRQVAQPYPVPPPRKTTTSIDEDIFDVQELSSHNVSFLRGTPPERPERTSPRCSFDIATSSLSYSSSTNSAASNTPPLVQRTYFTHLTSSPASDNSAITFPPVTTNHSSTIPFSPSFLPSGVVSALEDSSPQQVLGQSQSIISEPETAFTDAWRVDPIITPTGNALVLSASPKTITDLSDFDLAQLLGSDLAVDILTPEFHMLYSERRVRTELCGETTLKPGDRYYIPPEMFVGCYQVPRWEMPSMSRMAVLAARNFQALYVHLGVAHEPTFSMTTVNGLLAFALCTAPFCSPEAGLNDRDEVKDIVRNEKSGMMIKIFHRDHRKMAPGDILAIITALLMYHIPVILKPHDGKHEKGVKILHEVIEIARIAGLFKPTATFVNPVIKSYPNDEEKNERQWQKWINTEKFRRTAWLLYFLDTIVSLDPEVEPCLSPRDISHIPLPAPASLWSAETAAEWAFLYPLNPELTLTLDEAMGRVFGSPDNDCALLCGPEFGPFSRLVIMLTLLRGVIEFGQGAKDGGTVAQEWIVPSGRFNGMHLKFKGFVCASYTKALDRWRKGWDFDSYCYRMPNTKPLFAHDATPFYWLCVVLLGMLDASPDGDEATNRLVDANYQVMLEAARQFAESGEGIAA